MGLKSVIILISLLFATITEAQLEILDNLLGMIHIQGTVFCTLNSSTMAANGITIPVFPNAVVQLKCGEDAMSSVRTNGYGRFSVMLDPLNSIISSFLNDCYLKVETPLSSCNSTLPTVGSLLSPLLFIGNTLLGQLNVTNIIPAGFHFVP